MSSVGWRGEAPEPLLGADVGVGGLAAADEGFTINHGMICWKLIQLVSLGARIDFTVG